MRAASVRSRNARVEPSVVYLSHWYPALGERYVIREIEALRRQGMRVVIWAVRRSKGLGMLAGCEALREECEYLTPLLPGPMLLALGDCFRRMGSLRDIYRRIIWAGPERPGRRLKALVHIVLGAYWARLLPADVQHIHVNHGYFPAWAAMIVNRLRGIPYTLTLHGSDLLIDRVYIDLKVSNAKLVITISQFNKESLLHQVPWLPPERVVVNRLGVDIGNSRSRAIRPRTLERGLAILTVGRLHKVKNQVFLLGACRRLVDNGVKVSCRIAGAGPERRALIRTTRDLGLKNVVSLLGALPGRTVAHEYEAADLFVLTSLSEGLPIVLFEAMYHGLPVIAPAITGIPELVIDGETGWLYEPGNLEDLVRKVVAYTDMTTAERARVQHRAHERVIGNYDGARNAAKLARLIVARCGLGSGATGDACS